MEEPDSSPSALARNTLYSAVSEGSTLLVFLVGFLAARELGPAAFGEFSTAYAFVGLFRILPDFGMSYASTLAISRDRSLAERLTSNLLGFQAVLSALTLAASLGIGAWLYSGELYLAVLVLSLDLLLKSFKATLRWLLKSFQRYGAEAVSLIFERSALLCFAVFVLRSGYGLRGFVLVFLAVRLVDTTGLWAYVTRRVLPLRLAADGKLWRDLFFKGLPFAYAGAMILLFFQVDQVLLEKMRGPAEAGFYSAPVRVLEGLTLVPRILGFAFIPTLAALHAVKPEQVTPLYRRGCKYLLLVGLPIAAFSYLASDVFIPLLFGSEYERSVEASRVLLPAAVFMFLSNFGETALACIDRFRTIVVVSTLSVLLNVAMNLAWIPRYGLMGASWATLLTEGAYFLATAVAMEVYGHRAGWLRLSLRPVAAGLAFALCFAFLRGVLSAQGPLVGLLAASLVASAIWVLATLLLGVWDEKEWDLIRRRFRP